MQGGARTGTERICIREFPPLWIYRAGQAPPKRFPPSRRQRGAKPPADAADGSPQHF